MSSAMGNGPHHLLASSALTTSGRSGRPWASGPLLGLDTETTGTDPAQDRLVTAALVWRGPVAADGSRQHQVRTWLADPGVEIPEVASAVHGVTTSRARAEGLPVKDVLREVAHAVSEAMTAGTPVVAFNASFDLTLVEAELTRHSLPTLRERVGAELAPIVDPLVMDRAVDRFRRGKRRLADLCAVYGVTVDSTMHTAEVDVAATLDLLEAMVTAHPALARLRVDELVPWQAAAHRRWAESFNTWLAHNAPSRPPASLDWPVATASGR